VLGQLERLFAAVPRFAFRLDRTRWFDDQVQFNEITPHLTIGDGQPLASLRAAGESVGPLLPVTGEVTAVSLITQEITGGQFARTAGFGLARHRATPPEAR
jgi:hypothetical protein